MYKDIIFIFAVYGIIINIAGFAVMGVDKARARRRAWRVPEARLFLIACLGGSAGCLAGMYFFRHKTRHWYFVWGMPAILTVQAVSVLYFLYRCGSAFV